MSEITVLLERLNSGDREAFDELVPLVYDELRSKARRYLRGQPNGHTLQTTALVHEAFLKMLGPNAAWRDSRHFYNAAAEVMRQILVSHSRTKSAQKRGGKLKRVELPDVPAPLPEDIDWEIVDGALAELRKLDERRYQVVMLRYFAGLDDSQTARALEVSEKTVKRYWTTAKAFLRVWLAEHGR